MHSECERVFPFITPQAVARSTGGKGKFHLTWKLNEFVAARAVCHRHSLSAHMSVQLSDGKFFLINVGECCTTSVRRDNVSLLTRQAGPDRRVFNRPKKLPAQHWFNYVWKNLTRTTDRCAANKTLNLIGVNTSGDSRKIWMSFVIESNVAEFSHLSPNGRDIYLFLRKRRTVSPNNLISTESTRKTAVCIYKQNLGEMKLVALSMNLFFKHSPFELTNSRSLAQNFSEYFLLSY